MTKIFIRSILLLSLILLSAHKIIAQVDIPYWARMDSVMQHLNKSHITSGVLYDRVFPWAGITAFNPQTDTIDFEYSMQAWHEFYLATYNRAAIIDADKVTTMAAHNRDEGKGISVGYIFYNYHRLDSAAIDSGYLYFQQNDSSLREHTINGYKAYKAYQKVLPVVATEHLKAGLNTFYFDPDMVLKNVQGNYNVQIKLISGTNSITLTPGQTKNLNVTFSGSGRPRIRVDVVLAPGLSHSFPYYLFDLSELGMINSLTTTECKSGETPIPIWSGSSLTFQGYDETSPTQGLGEYTVFYKMNSTAAGDCIDNKITKPIIVLDGFDPQNGAQETPEDLWELLSYEGGHFGDDMRTSGYDIVVLNFPVYKDAVQTGGEWRDGGTDFIERNAMVLIAMINKVKQELITNGSSEEIAIIGPSMGGQIARYALKYMENNSMNHNTRLFIAFDSPNHGANIPIGLQNAVYHFGVLLNKKSIKDLYTLKLASKAGRQMLIHQLGVRDTVITFLGLPFATTYKSFHETFHDQWQGDIDAMGYPDNLRKVALIDGNQFGQYFNPSSPMLNLRLKAEVGPFTFNDIARLRLWHLPPSYSSGQVFDMDIEIPPSALFNFLDASLSYYNPTPYGNIDAAPGGTYPSLLEIKKKLPPDSLATYIDEISPFLGDIISLQTYYETYSGDRQSFIPSASSLGFIDPDFNWATADFRGRDLVCEGEIVFDNYFTEVDKYYKEKKNADHVAINPQSAKWAYEEIVYGQDGCPNICATGINSTIPGDYMCGTDEYVFSLNELVPSSVGSVFWEPPTGLVPVTHTSINNNSIKLKWDGTSFPPEESYVKATVTPKISGQQCGATKVFYFPVKFGDIFSYELSPSATTDLDFTVYVVPNSLGDYQYKWRDDNADPWPSGFSSNYSRYYYKVDTGVTKYFSVRIYPDGCSTYVKQITGMYLRKGMGVSEDGLPMAAFVPYIQVETPTLMPNPTDANWQLVLPQEWKGKQAVATVYASDGRKMYSVSVTDIGYTTLTIENLAAGVYFIEVISDSERAVVRGIKK